MTIKEDKIYQHQRTHYAREVPNQKIKKRPCLRCDRPFITTPDMRLCAQCSSYIAKAGIGSGVASASVQGSERVNSIRNRVSK